MFFLVVTVLTVGGLLIFWQHGQPRREATASISKFSANLSNPHGFELLDTILIPVAIQSRTPAEQEEFIVKALTDEISPAGVEALKRQAKFGSLKSIFPDESSAWSSQAGVNADVRHFDHRSEPLEQHVEMF